MIIILYSFILQLRDADEGEKEPAEDGKKKDITVDKETETATPPILEELIDSCSHFLTGPPSEYIDWLRSQNIKTITDLGAAIIVDEAMLGTGSGKVGIIPGTEGNFSSVVLLAVSGKSATKTGGAAATPEEIKEERERRDKEAEKEEKRKRARGEAVKRGKEKKKEKRYVAVKKAKERIDLLKKTIEVAKTSLANQKIQLQTAKSPLGIKMKQLQKLRADIADIKGNDTEEDLNFHIDRSRDDRGFTFLMVAAQNDDFFTAKTCFDLGADAYATSSEGLTAIDFSYFFGFENVTSLIVQVRPMYTLILHLL